ncbi:Rapid ALkalinization Factor protein [Dioscorea alata]|uniref:Rapid ALkalinization Factor protein n=2 Tax=Dioscorea alata TaxID=55571 RepID=A0ACB7VGY6_DIOAL|nr:Rapid ALkalinization Factor protein [Dioscorea alata]KAH7673373.1 Rapid ALkalinization Factor protein [Dioscorea alata]
MKMRGVLCCCIYFLVLLQVMITLSLPPAAAAAAAASASATGKYNDSISNMILFQSNADDWLLESKVNINKGALIADKQVCSSTPGQAYGPCNGNANARARGCSQIYGCTNH